MQVTGIVPRLRPGKSYAPLLLALALFAGAGGLAVGRQRTALGALVVLSVGAFVVARPFIPWWSFMGTILFTILFIPIGRYVLPGGLPFDLEPYRLFIGVILIIWTASLLTDARISLRATGLEGPMLAIVLIAFASDAANPYGVRGVEANVIKSLIFFLSFVLFYYYAASTVRTWLDLDRILKFVVGGSAILGIFAILEYRIGFTPFNSLGKVFPFLEFRPLPLNSDDAARGGHLRAITSAEHSIAFGALMVMMLPLTIYLVKKYGRRWLVATALLAIGSVTALSRTPIVMLVGAGLMILWLRPHAIQLSMKKVAIGLAVALVVIKVVAPGAVGSIRYQFAPKGGIVAQQSTSKGSAVSGGRLTDVGPVLDDAKKKPLLGAGFGVRIVGRTSVGSYSGGRILDDQWLGLLNDEGSLGVLGWLWFYWAFLRRVRRAARITRGDEGWLLVGVAASVFGFMIGMFTFDAFSFTQEAFVLYLIFAIGALASRPGMLTGVRLREALPAP